MTEANFGPNDISDTLIRTILYLKYNGLNIDNRWTPIFSLSINNDKYIYSNWDYQIPIPTLSDLQSITNEELELTKLIRNFKISTVSIYTTEELNILASNIAVPNGTIAFNSDLLKGVIYFNGTWN